MPTQLLVIHCLATSHIYKYIQEIVIKLVS